MAVQANFDSPDREKFQYCYAKLMGFSYQDEDNVKTDLNLMLDQLNSLEYASIIVKEQDGNRLLLRLCSIIPLHEERFVVKFCQITNCWKRKQMLSLTDQCLSTVMDYLIRAIERCQTWTRPDILRALATLMYESCDKVLNFHDRLLGTQGVLVQLINDEVTDADTLKEAVLCVECLTLKPATSTYLSSANVDICFDMFTMLLHKIPSTNLDQLSQCRILINCLRGLQNMLQVTKFMSIHKLGTVLASVRAYMFFGLYSQPVVIPDSLYPSPLTNYDTPLLGKMSEPPSAKFHADKEDNTGQKKAKRKTRKKPDKQASKQEASNKTDEQDERVDPDSSVAMATGTDADMMSTQPVWAKISSSDSDWSDTEGGQSLRLRSTCTKVRQCALNCFYWVAKTADKKLMFSYWSSFIPDTQTATNMTNTQTLFTIVLKDPSPKCRMGALAALAVLVDGTKMLLNAAEDSDDKKTSTFTPFSVVLGSTIKEIHRCLLLALVSEEYPITLTQLIKCFGTVIANVPYHRMRPGLLSRIVKQIRHFINHRDPNVRVACLTCLGSMSGIQPPLMEVCHIIQSPKPPVSSKPPIAIETDRAVRESDTGSSTGQNIPQELDSGFSSSIPNVNLSSSFGGTSTGEHSGGTTPRKGTASSSGTQTPVFSDKFLQAQARDISWVVKLCVKNILPQYTSDTVLGMEDAYVEPLPVRLESLQVLAHLTKGYFPIIRNCVPLLQELVHKCYCDKDPVIKLHTAKLLDEFTQVLLQDLQNKNSDTSAVERLDKKQVMDFWLSLLNGPIQDILQNPSHGAVRATTCDCIANIGDEIFTSIPLDKRIMCLTVVLGLTSDEDRFIRASAIRTLGVYVLYKSLREDVSFITDSTTAILGAMVDKNIAVRVKAAWSLANLCDALTLNREEGDSAFVEDFPVVLLLNVITMATKACQDSDKVKANGVRALGNILRYVTTKNLGKETFSQAVGNAVKSLVKNVGSGAMKVRWNACYAVSNLYKNTDLHSGSASWNADLIKVLCNVVKDCKNFKVRINAAIALSSPRERSQYGDVALYCHVWQGVIDAFCTAEDIADYIDFRYRDSLTDQICASVLHLVSLLQVSDLEHLSTIIQTHGDQLMTCMDKYYSYKQKDSQIDVHLPLAKAQLDVLHCETLSDVQASCLEVLTTMCEQLAPGFEEKPKVKSSFVMTYD